MIHEKSVFANNELSLRDIAVYGFDYDYTLAHYTNELNNLIYQMSLEKLINEYSYPEELRTMTYDPEFVIRGLHIDINKGIMMKIDSYQNIMPGTAYRGYQQISEEDIHRYYRGTHIGNDQIIPTRDNNDRPRMRHMIDLFANSEATLMANVFEYFAQKNIEYDPAYVFRDCQETVRKVHRSGQIGSTVEKDIGQYLHPNRELQEFLQSLLESGKQTFLITNSDFNFVNKGMIHMLGETWMELFDVVITSARKPSFYLRTDRPFRSLDSKGRKTWERVSHFHGGELYTEGNVEQFMKFTGWYGPKVLYFGDHVYSDLMGPILKHGWRTGAIIHDLEKEIKISNTEEFRRSVTWLLSLQQLIEALQSDNSDEAYELLREWKRERYMLREELKNMFNPQFGSVFRTYHNPSYFTRRLVRFADIYSSSISNLLNYSNDVTFYPRRQALPHEPFIELFA
ncbi:5'-nucleotidase domain-containing protein 2-like [Dendronephthya gigantea]|uniref:5'-nucleotidase domain-containing protein 2-like n=1 Tax=Dendronephthya gigantea TaxID=151771 RepID=UPI00106A722C|nr:5'-nucleotidase domain-containing protein 2-like [Dendronephthya gigantea]